MKTTIVVFALLVSIASAEYVDEKGVRHIGSPDAAAQQRMLDAKNVQNLNKVPLFKIGRERAYVEEILHSLPNVEIVTLDQSFITYIATITEKGLTTEASSKIPTESVTHRTGPNTWETQQVPAKPIQTIMGGREGIKDVYADGTVIIRGGGKGTLTEEQYAYKVQVTFKDGLVDATKVLNKTRL